MDKETLESTKKVPYIQGQRGSHSEMVGGV